jgi:hypothetical protein
MKGIAKAHYSDLKISKGLPTSRTLATMESVCWQVKAALNSCSQRQRYSTYINGVVPKQRCFYVGFEVLTAVTTKMDVSWFVAPYSLVEVYQRFRGPCCLRSLKRW